MRRCVVLPPSYNKNEAVIRGLFHRWILLKDYVYALVEKRDGKMIFVDFYRIQFTDDEFDKTYNDEEDKLEKEYYEKLAQNNTSGENT